MLSPIPGQRRGLGAPRSQENHQQQQQQGGQPGYGSGVNSLLFSPSAEAPSKRHKTTGFSLSATPPPPPATTGGEGHRLCALPPKELEVSAENRGHVESGGWVLVAGVSGTVCAWEVSIALQGVGQARAPRKAYTFDLGQRRAFSSHLPFLALLHPIGTDGGSRGLVACSPTGELAYWTDVRSQVGEASFPIEHVVPEIAERGDAIVDVVAVGYSDLVLGTERGDFIRLSCNARLREVRHQQIQKPGGLIRGLNQVIFGSGPEQLVALRPVPRTPEAFLALTQTSLQWWILPAPGDRDQETCFQDLPLLQRLRQALSRMGLAVNGLELVDVVATSSRTAWLLTAARGPGLELTLHELRFVPGSTGGQGAAQIELTGMLKRVSLGSAGGDAPPTDGRWLLLGSDEAQVDGTVYLKNVSHPGSRVRRLYHLPLDGVADHVRAQPLFLASNDCLAAGLVSGHKAPFVVGAEGQLFIPDLPERPAVPARPSAAAFEAPQGGDAEASDASVEEWPVALRNAFFHREGEIQQVSRYLEPVMAHVKTAHTRHAPRLNVVVKDLSREVIDHEMNGSALVHHVLSAKQKEHADLIAFLDVYVWNNCHPNWRSALMEARFHVAQHRQQLKAAAALEEVSRRASPEKVLRRGLVAAVRGRHGDDVLSLRSNTTGLQPSDLFFEQPSRLAEGLREAALAASHDCDQSVAEASFEPLVEAAHATLVAFAAGRGDHHPSSPCWTGSAECRQILRVHFDQLQRLLKRLAGRHQQVEGGVHQGLAHCQALYLDLAKLWLDGFRDLHMSSARTTEDYQTSKDAVLVPLLELAKAAGGAASPDRWLHSRQGVLALCEEHLIFDGLVEICAWTEDEYGLSDEGLQRLKTYMSHLEKERGTADHAFPLFCLRWFDDRERFADVLALGKDHPDVLAAHLQDKPYRWVDELRTRQFDAVVGTLGRGADREPHFSTRKTLLSIAKLACLAQGTGHPPVSPSTSAAAAGGDQRLEQLRLIERNLALMQVQENIRGATAGPLGTAPATSELVMREEDMIEAVVRRLSSVPSVLPEEVAKEFAMYGLITVDIVYEWRPAEARALAQRYWKALQRYDYDKWQDLCAEDLGGDLESGFECTLLFQVAQEHALQLRSGEFAHRALQLDEAGGLAIADLDIADRILAQRMRQCVSSAKAKAKPTAENEAEKGSAPPFSLSSAVAVPPSRAAPSPSPFSLGKAPVPASPFPFAAGGRRGGSSTPARRAANDPSSASSAAVGSFAFAAAPGVGDHDEVP